MISRAREDPRELSFVIDDAGSTPMSSSQHEERRLGQTLVVDRERPTKRLRIPGGSFNSELLRILQQLSERLRSGRRKWTLRKEPATGRGLLNDPEKRKPGISPDARILFICLFVEQAQLLETAQASRGARPVIGGPHPRHARCEAIERLDPLVLPYTRNLDRSLQLGVGHATNRVPSSLAVRPPHPQDTWLS